MGAHSGLLGSEGGPVRYLGGRKGVPLKELRGTTLAFFGVGLAPLKVLRGGEALTAHRGRGGHLRT